MCWAVGLLPDCYHSLSYSSLPVSWALVNAAAPLGGHSEISRAGLLHSEGLPQSHVCQYIQWDEASLLPAEDSDEAVLFFLRSHTDLNARGERRKALVQQEQMGTCSVSCC